MNYKCIVQKRDYSEYSYEPHNEDIKNPQESFLFNGDVFEYNNEKVSIIESQVRQNKNIPGILILENNRTFGRTQNKKKLYYKCKPNDSTLPFFLIPYNMPMGFNKNFKNKYITFYFHEWKDKHPYGVISQSLGDVYHLPSFYEYQLYCKSLHESITKAVTATKEKLQEKPMEKYHDVILKNPKRFGRIIPIKEEYIFSIDPEGCVDRDDALSIKRNTENDFQVSVYIANVWVWLDILKLWSDIGNRVSTIYFPDFKRPMLPTSIGETLCSLDENKEKFVFVMKFRVFRKENTYKIEGEPSLEQASVTVSNNYVYEEEGLLKNKEYKMLREITGKLDKGIKDSHEVVAYWMMQMNNYVAMKMKTREIGIFRTVKSKNIINDTEIPKDVPSFIRIWEQQMSGSYVCCKEDLQHEMLGLSEYVHFTSPIRRMVDLLNQIWWVLYEVRPPKIASSVQKFYKGQLDELNMLNTKMKKIRRIQADSFILDKVMNNDNDYDNILNKEYEATVLCVDDKSKWTIYIEELQWMTNVYSEILYGKYQKVKCKLYIFEKEDQMRKKIRVSII